MAVAPGTEQMKVKKLNALTSLRFFAAALIVVHHSRGHFGVPIWINEYFPTYQGVAFFFVLSGFILTYVYQSFHSMDQVKRFFVARIARVWPLHVVTLIITLLLFHRHYMNILAIPEKAKEFWTTLAANLFMVHGWIPLRDYFWSFNAPSWSISTEFGFYLLFPLLLAWLKRAWKLLLGLAFGVSVGVVLLCMILKLPASVTHKGIGVVGVININPLVRVFEFCVGMSACLFLGRFQARYRAGVVKGTLIEVGLVLAVVLFMSTNGWWMRTIHSFLGAAGMYWVGNGVLNSPFFAILILCFAVPRGLIAKALCKRPFVLLGEISFSIYLLHHILIKLYEGLIEPIDSLPAPFSYLYFWAVLLAASYLLWTGIERPSRRAIIKLATGNYHFQNGGRYGNGFSPIRTGAALLIVGALITPVIFFVSNTPPICIIGKQEAHLISLASYNKYKNIAFGEKFVLLSADFIVDNNNTELRLVWEAKENTKLTMAVGVHFLDKDGNIIGKTSYFQSQRIIGSYNVDKGTIWCDKVRVPREKLEHLKFVGICIYSWKRLLPISKGPRDWGGKRLLIKWPG